MSPEGLTMFVFILVADLMIATPFVLIGLWLYSEWKEWKKCRKGHSHSSRRR